MMVWGTKFLYVLALGVWLGEIAFFSFVVAPRIFGALPVEEAGRIVGSIFPTYYRLGYACGAVLMITALLLWRVAGGFDRWAVTSGLAAIMLGATVYAGMVIQPRAQALRPHIHDPAAAPAAKAEFDQLHRRAVQLNAVVLLGGVLAAGITASGLRP